MGVGRELLGTVLLLLLVTTPDPAGAQGMRLADGNDWRKSSPLERRAYVIGIANTLAVGHAYESTKLAGRDKTFVRQAARALRGTTVERATAIIDGWYKANPSQLHTPVLTVVWREIAQPGLAVEK